MKKLLLVVAMLGLVGCGGPSAEQKAETAELVRLIMDYDSDGDWAPVHARISAAKLPIETSTDLLRLAGAMKNLPEIRPGNESRVHEQLLYAVTLARKLNPDFRVR